jgi:hypothetical protein
MRDGGTPDRASASQWIAEAGHDLIVGAFGSKEDAVGHYPSDRSLLISPVPRAVASGRFVWVVSTRDDRIDSFHGGDAEAATRRSEGIDGKLILLLADEAEQRLTEL